ncbi:MAG: biotin synthase [Defluviitaleaceae bacterium]|nr:biotin synthase [Defluviitaleaceae bacterium]
MTNILIKESLDLTTKINLMQRDTLFDVSDGNAVYVPDLASIKNEIKSKPTLPPLPKMMLSNDCIFNCAYCWLRAGLDNNDRYTNSPREMAEISVNAAKSCGQGVFITSAICKNANYTGELILETLRIIRQEHRYTGFIHAKVMPGTDPELIHQTGFYANRMSINIEVAKSEGYAQIARNKSKEKIITPLRQIHNVIKAGRDYKLANFRHSPYTASSQATQIMAGSTNEKDYEILRLSNALYQKYELKRVYYTPFHYTWDAKGYNDLPQTATPVWRMKRLYQADRLMEIYGFTPEEIAPESDPNLAYDFDPKAAWAIRNIHLYPVEVNKADYEMLIRIPGIGTTYAKRIIKARRSCKITHDVLRQLGVSLKRSRHFITCNGIFDGEKSDSVEVYKSLLISPLND